MRQKVWRTGSSSERDASGGVTSSVMSSKSDRSFWKRSDSSDIRAPLSRQTQIVSVGGPSYPIWLALKSLMGLVVVRALYLSRVVVRFGSGDIEVLVQFDLDHAAIV